MANCSSPKTRQRGTTLLEGLVAFLVLSLGMLSVVRVQSQLRLNSDVARQRSEAVRLAQEEMEKMRAFSVIAARAGASAYASLASATAIFDANSGQPGNTSYRMTRDISAADVPNSKNATVNVSWDDRTGNTQQVVLNSLISGHDPAYSGALKLMAPLQPTRAALARSPLIPLGAADLGNGSSAFKPLSTAGEWLVQDNTSGLVTARCAAGNPSVPANGLRAADLRSCEPLRAYLISGVVRFSAAEPPDAQAANDIPAALAVALSSSSAISGTPSCSSEALKTVSYSMAGQARTEGLPLSASAATLAASAWVETGERYVAYHCVVAPGTADAAWSGRTSITPAGWTLGTGPTDRRVCRFTAGLDRSGAVDNNLEHPDSYTALTASLSNQNFLIIKGNQSCPTRSATAAGFADLGTAQHQP